MISIHPLADVQSPTIGEGTRIWQFSVVLPNAVIGKDCNINALTFIENDVVLGDRVTVKSGVQLWDGLRIADGVFIGPNVTFTNDLLPRSRQHPDSFVPTVIEEGASIGANATLIAGVHIGTYAMVGAGALVSRSVKAHELVYGNPAAAHGFVCQCGNKLASLRCVSCGRRYAEIDVGITQLMPQR